MNRILGLIYLSLTIVASSSFSQQTFWTHTNGPGTGLDVRAFATNSHGDLYAGTWTNCEVWKTSNNGDVWTLVSPSPLVSGGVVLGLAITPNDHIFASTFTRGVYRSTNDGQTWTAVNNGLTNFNVRASVVDDSGYVFVATEGGLFRTTDDGNTWANKLPILCSLVELDSSHAVVTTDGTTLYRSTNHGAEWQFTTITGTAGGLGQFIQTVPTSTSRFLLTFSGRPISVHHGVTSIFR